MNSFAEFNNVYAKHMGDHKPSRSTVEVARLPKDALVEVRLCKQAPRCTSNAVPSGRVHRAEQMTPKSSAELVAPGHSVYIVLDDAIGKWQVAQRLREIVTFISGRKPNRRQQQICSLRPCPRPFVRSSKRCPAPSSAKPYEHQLSRHTICLLGRSDCTTRYGAELGICAMHEFSRADISPQSEARPTFVLQEMLQNR